MKTLVAIFLSAGLLIGCSATYERKQSDATAGSASIPASASVYIGVPENGKYGRTVYQNSGAMTAQAVFGAFANHVKRAQLSPGVVKRLEGLSQARTKGFNYYAEPTILHWEDRATEWSGRQDRIAILISVFDVSTGKEIDRTTIKGTSRWFTFGGDHPQDMLDQPINEHVAGLIK